LHELHKLAVGVSRAKAAKIAIGSAAQPPPANPRSENRGSRRNGWSRRTEMNNKLHLVSIRKHAARLEMRELATRELKDGTTGRPILTQVWAVADAATPRPQACEALRDAVVDPEVGAHRVKPIPVKDGIPFYRKYTEGMLRRYLQLSMAGGRVSSLLRRKVFGAEITNYSVQNFEGVSIFCVDVELCLKKLTPMERALLKRIAVQQYTFVESAPSFGFSLRTCKQRYYEALDRLTVIFLETRILEPLKSYRDGKEVLVGVSHSEQAS